MTGATPRVVVTRTAADQITALARWWGENRPAARGKFLDALQSALEGISRMPFVGRAYDHPALPGLRRVLVRISGHHVYYTTDEAMQTITVHAVWHAARGGQPRLE